LRDGEGKGKHNGEEDKDKRCGVAGGRRKTPRVIAASLREKTGAKGGGSAVMGWEKREKHVIVLVECLGITDAGGKERCKG